MFVFLLCSSLHRKVKMFFTWVTVVTLQTQHTGHLTMVQVNWPQYRLTDHSTSYMFSLTTQHTVAELKTAVILSDWQYLFQSTSAGFWQVCVDRDQDFLQTRSLLCFVNHMTTHTHLLVCVKYIYVHACMYYSNSICWLMCCTSYRYR